MIAPKDLKKLAAACRKAGIKTFKQGDVEITLNDDVPYTSRPRKTASKADNATEQTNEIPFETDTLSEEQLLFWSVGAGGVHATLPDASE